MLKGEPKNTNALKLKKAQNELTSIYLKEQTEYIQNQIERLETRWKIGNTRLPGKR